MRFGNIKTGVDTLPPSRFLQSGVTNDIAIAPECSETHWTITSNGCSMEPGISLQNYCMLIHRTRVEARLVGTWPAFSWDAV